MRLILVSAILIMRDAYFGFNDVIKLEFLNLCCINWWCIFLNSSKTTLTWTIELVFTPYYNKVFSLHFKNLPKLYNSRFSAFSPKLFAMILDNYCIGVEFYNVNLSPLPINVLYSIAINFYL